MRALVVGCGSMGKRRIRDLMGKEAQVTACDPREDRREEIKRKFGIKAVESFEAGRGEYLDAAFVCVPPFLHARYVKMALQAGLHVFSEAPLALTLDDIDEIAALAESSSKLVAPSSTYLHHFYNVKVKEFLKNEIVGKPLCFQSHFGGHLAGWHPYEGLDFYAIDRRHGGMGFDVLVHQLHLVQYLVGPVDSVLCLAAKRSTIPAPSGYDMYDLLLDCPGTSATVHCDVVQRPARTFWTVWGEGGTINWTWQQMTVYSADGTERIIELPEHFNYEMTYLAELSHVLDAMNNRATYCHSLSEEKNVLRTLLAAEQSAKSGNAVSLKATQRC